MTVNPNDFETFAEALRSALAHLHDPHFDAPPVLGSVLDCGPQAAVVQSEIMRRIRELEPPEALPQDARARQHFDLLRHRYVLKLTQEQTAEALHMSVRSVRRAQRAATHTLARMLWEQYLARTTASAEGDVGQGQPEHWRDQVRQDLIALQANAPARLSGVAEAVRYAVDLESRRLARRGIELRAGAVPPDLTTAIHPSVLRQILIMAIGEFSRTMQSGLVEIEAAAAEQEAQVEIVLRAPREPGAVLPDRQFVQEILDVLGGEAQVAVEAGMLAMTLAVPLVRQIKVLVIDDNLDQVHFYRRCVMGTRYVILHAERGQRTVEHVAEVAPGIIVLDVIMPDADGWDLLTQLREHPATRHIPVILCSIVREGDLADDLGADRYLPKPIQYREFLHALDQMVE